MHSKVLYLGVFKRCVDSFGLSIAQSSGELTTSDVLLAAKRLVEGYSDEEITASIDEIGDNNGTKREIFF